MKNQTENEISYLKKQITKLPCKAINAVCFMIDNFDMIKEMCKNVSFGYEEIQERIGIAKEKEDYISMIILCAAKVLKNAEE